MRPQSGRRFRGPKIRENSKWMGKAPGKVCPALVLLDACPVFSALFERWEWTGSPADRRGAPQKGKTPWGFRLFAKGPEPERRKTAPGAFQTRLRGVFPHGLFHEIQKKDVQVIGGIVRFRHGAAKVIFA